MQGVCQNGDCLNTLGSFKCSCKAGLVLDRNRCVGEWEVALGFLSSLLCLSLNTFDSMTGFPNETLSSPLCQSLQLSRPSASWWRPRSEAASTRCPPASPRKCAAARWAKHGAATVKDVLRRAQVSGRRRTRSCYGLRKWPDYFQ